MLGAVKQYASLDNNSGSACRINLAPAKNLSTYIVFISARAYFVHYYENELRWTRFCGDSDPSTFDSFVVENGYLKIKTTVQVAYTYVSCFYLS